MRVLMLNQYFYPDIAATSQLATDLAVDLARRGHDVVAIASSRQYAAAGKLPRSETYRKVRIVRVPATGFGRRRRLLRALDYVTFLASSVVPLFRAQRPDVIIALSTPPFLAVLGLLARQLRGVRLVFWVMDVYPEVAVKIGALKARSPATRAMKKLSRAILTHADDVIALDEAMSEVLTGAGANPARIHVIDNWCDGDEIRPVSIGTNELRATLGLGDCFTVSYSGNMGLGHDLDTVVGAMEALRDEPVHWLFIGDGPQKKRIQRLAVEREIARISFLEYREREELPVSLTAAHASLVTMRSDVAGLIVPSKVYGLLAAGVPLLYVGPVSGRVGEIVRDHRVGLDVRNGDAAGLANAVMRLKDDAGERAEMSRRARTLFDSRFARPLALERHHTVLTHRMTAVPRDCRPTASRT